MARRALLLLGASFTALLLQPKVEAQPSIEPVAGDVAFPTNVAFAPDGRIFFTEKETGNVRIIRDGRLLPESFVHLPVEGSAERGLLGIALDPDFERQPWCTSTTRRRGARPTGSSVSEPNGTRRERSIP